MSFKDKEKEAAYQKAYRESHKRTMVVYMKAYRKLHKKDITVQRKAYRKLHKEDIAVYRKNYDELHKKDLIIHRKNYNELHKEKLVAHRKVYNKLHKKEHNIYTKNKYKTNFNYRLNQRMSGGIRGSLKNGNGKNGHHWEDLVPYTLDDLIKRLKKTLPVGYTWKDYINGNTDLHIDHIVPIKAHNFTSYKHVDFQRCWALKNLQLLPALKNKSKHAKLEKPFQPSLLL